MQTAGSLQKRRPRNIAKGFKGKHWEDASKFDSDYLQDYSSPIVLSTRVSSRRIRRDSSNPRQQENIIYDDDGFATLNSAIIISHRRIESAEDIRKNLSTPSYLLCPSDIFKLRLIIYLGRSVFLFPWSWHQNKNRLEIRQLSRPIQLIYYVFSTITLLLSLTLTLFHLRLLINNYKAAGNSYRMTFKSLEAICWHFHSVLCNLSFTFYREDMRVYINTLLTLNKELLVQYGNVNEVRYQKDFRKDGKLFMNMTIPVFMTQIVLSIIRYLFLHDAPIYLTSYWVPNQQNISKILIFFGLFQDYMTGGQLVTGHLFLGWMAVAHAISLKFWLEESHRNNESERTSDVIRQSSESIKLYRILEVISTQFNTTVAIVAVPLCAFMNWSAAIACGYVFVRSANHLFVQEFPMSLFYPLGITITLCSPFTQFQMAAIMHDTAGSFLDSWSFSRDKGFRRFLTSCPILKVQVVGVTTVTRSSLITYLQTVTNYIIDCIVTFP